MKILFVAAFIGLIYLIKTISADDWEKWKKKHNKNYSDNARHNVRQVIFLNNLEKINKHNAKNLSFKMGTNHFSDLSDEEIASRYTMEIDEESVKTLIKKA